MRGDIGRGPGIPEGGLDDLHVNVSLLHPHPVLVQPRAVIELLRHEAAVLGGSGHHHVATQRDAQFVAADPVSDILIQVVRIPRGNAQFLRKMVEQRSAQFKLHRHTVRQSFQSPKRP